MTNDKLKAGFVSRPASIPEDVPYGLPNCGVVAVAVLAGVSHAKAWETLKPLQRGKGKGWKGSTYDHDRQKALAILGVQFELVQGVRGMTLGQWFKSDLYAASQTYEVVITRHAMALHRGRLFDQNGGGRFGHLIHETPFKRRKIHQILRITGGTPLRGE